MSLRVDLEPLFGMYFISVIIHTNGKYPSGSPNELYTLLAVVIAAAVVQFYIAFYTEKTVLGATGSAITIVVFSTHIPLMIRLDDVFPKIPLYWVLINSTFLVVTYITLSVKINKDIVLSFGATSVAESTIPAPNSGADTSTSKRTNVKSDAIPTDNVFTTSMSNAIQRAPYRTDDSSFSSNSISTD